MNTCDTCKFWMPRKDARFAHSTARECRSDKVSELAYGDDTLSYSYHEDGEILTGPKFGCIHHEPKE